MKITASLLLAILVLIVFAVAVGTAQPSLTTVADTIYNSVGGAPFNGSVTIQGPNTFSPTNIPVMGTSRTINIVNGVLSVQLVPNDTAFLASTYQFRFSNGDIKTCFVPTSITPVTLAGANCIEGVSPAVMTLAIGLPQLGSGGATTGQGLCFNGIYWAPGNCVGSGGGGVWGAITGTLSNQTDLQNALNATTNASNLTSGTLNHARLPALVSADIPNNSASTTGSAAKLNGSAIPPSLPCAGTNSSSQIISGSCGGGSTPANPNITSIVTALGDSLTRGFGWGATTANNSYPAVLMHNTGLNTINISVGGYDSGQILGFMSSQTAPQLAGLWLMWPGRNDINGGVWNGIAPSNGQSTAANIASMVALVTAAGGDYIVMSVLNACANQEYTGGSGQTSYTNILANNAAEASTYGTRYLDIRGTLVAVDNDGGHDCPGPSLTSSGVHLNDTGYALVATTDQIKIQTIWGGLTPTITAAVKASQLQGPAIPVYTVTGTGDAMVVTSYPPFDLTNGRLFCISAPSANVTTSVTMGFNGIVGNIAVVKQGAAALAAGDITTTISPCFNYHLISSSSWQLELINPQTSSGGWAGQTAGPDWLFGFPTGALGDAGTTFSSSGSNLTVKVWPFSNAFQKMPFNSLTWQQNGADAGKFLAVGIYDHTKTLVCTSTTFALGSSFTQYNITWGSTCNFTDGSGFVGMATNSTVIDYESQDISGTGTPEVFMLTAPTIVKGNASNLATISGSTITMPQTLGTITSSFDKLPALYRQ